MHLKTKMSLWLDEKKRRAIYQLVQSDSLFHELPVGWRNNPSIPVNEVDPSHWKASLTDVTIQLSPDHSCKRILKRAHVSEQQITSRGCQCYPCTDQGSLRWVGGNHSALKEMVIDFRSKQHLSPSASWAEEEFKYLGVTIAKRLSWRNWNPSAWVCCDQQVYWVKKLIRKVDSEIGCKQSTFNAVMEKRTLNKLLSYNLSSCTGRTAEHLFQEVKAAASLPHRAPQEIIPTSRHKSHLIRHPCAGDKLYHYYWD